MSGGHFDYHQYKLRYIADSIEQIILNNGKKKENKEVWEDEYNYTYPPEVIEEFKKAWEIIRKAEIYAQRVDWIVSGDDGDKSFIKRLEEDLKNFENEKTFKWEGTVFLDPKE